MRTIDKSQEEEMPKAERKKLLKIVQQFLKSIKSKEKRKKTKKVLTKIANQAKVLKFDNKQQQSLYELISLHINIAQC